MVRGGRSLSPLAALVGVVACGWLSGCLGLGDSDEPEPAEGERVIVSVGDSAAAGEGNPAPKGRRWLRPTRCHRSKRSAHAIAAEELIAANPDAGLRFASYACSGATIERGLLGPFLPRLDQPPEPPQLDRVDDLAEKARVEALTVSIGANDIGFGQLVAFCAQTPRCEQSRRYPPAQQFALQERRPVPTLAEFVSLAIEGLADSYRAVDGRIPPEIDRERVLIVEYFDFTRWPARRQCPIGRTPSSPEGASVSADESRWIHDQVLVPLNEAVRAAAEEHGWTLVEGVDERFDGHGICGPKPERWVLTVGDSLAVQGDPLGALHPNRAGQRATAELLRARLADVLGLDAAAGGAPGSAPPGS